MGHLYEYPLFGPIFASIFAPKLPLWVWSDLMDIQSIHLLAINQLIIGFKAEFWKYLGGSIFKY